SSEDVRQLEGDPGAEREADHRQDEAVALAEDESADDPGELAGNRRDDDLKRLQEDENGGRVGAEGGEKLGKALLLHSARLQVLQLLPLRQGVEGLRRVLAQKENEPDQK